MLRDYNKQEYQSVVFCNSSFCITLSSPLYIRVQAIIDFLIRPLAYSLLFVLTKSN